MYADRVEAVAKTSVKDRLNGNTIDDFGRRRQIAGKRQRHDDDRWEHDLYEDGEPQLSSRKLGARDLRLKLQKKGTQQGKGSISGVRDLREKLSGAVHSQPINRDLPRPEAAKPARKSVAVEASLPDTKKVADPVPRKRTLQKEQISPFFMLYFLHLTFTTFTKLAFLAGVCCYHVVVCLNRNEDADTSVDGFLQSLGLEKYSITFQAEEIDMTALVHMSDEDLRALGIPMGPRKKILLSLDSRT